MCLHPDNSEKNKGGDTKGWTPVVGELLKKHACAGVGNSFETVEPVAEPLREVECYLPLVC